MDAEAVQGACQEAMAWDLIQAIPGSPEVFIFSHDRVRQVLYRELSESERVRLHGLAGHCLEMQMETRPRATVFEIAHHFRLTSQPEKAIQALHHAGDAAREDFAFHEAVRYYQDLLATHPETLRHVLDAEALGRVHETLGDCQMALGSYEEAMRSYHAGRTCSPNPVSHIRLQRKAGETLFREGRLRDALDTLHESESGTQSNG